MRSSANNGGGHIIGKVPTRTQMEAFFKRMNDKVAQDATAQGLGADAARLAATDMRLCEYAFMSMFEAMQKDDLGAFRAATEALARRADVAWGAAEYGNDPKETDQKHRKMDNIRFNRIEA